MANLAGFVADFDQFGSDLHVFTDAQFLDEIGVGVDDDKGQLTAIVNVIWCEGPCRLQGETRVRTAIEVTRNVHVAKGIAI